MAGPKPTFGKQKPRRLNLVAVVLVSAAILFSAYCGLHSSLRYQVATANALSGGKLTGHSTRILLKDSDIGTGSNTAGQVTTNAAGTATAAQGTQSTTGQAQGQVQTQQAQQTQAQQAVTIPCTATLASHVNTHNPRKYHVVTTVQGFANHWQARIHYYWYKKQREICEANGEVFCDMGGFTRLLHSGMADDLMDEIPTVVVNPLPEEMLKSSSYVVLNRPYAFLQWLDKVSIPEKYIMMAEADHLFIRPMPNLMYGEYSAAALFSYIVPSEYKSIVRKFVGQVSDEEIKKIPQIGNSPTFISVRDFRRVAPEWLNTTIAIFDDEEAHKAWNWVLEMYGYTLATYRTNTHQGLYQYNYMLAHPPFDTGLKTQWGDAFYLLHLTYPLRYTKYGNITENESEVIWKFDKRSYMNHPPPRNLPDPPEIVKNELTRLIIKMVNEATSNIPCWDTYVASNVVTTQCSSAPSGSIADGVKVGNLSSIVYKLQKQQKEQELTQQKPQVVVQQAQQQQAAQAQAQGVQQGATQQGQQAVQQQQAAAH